jgi:hypothetical protein
MINMDLFNRIAFAMPLLQQAQFAKHHRERPKSDLHIYPQKAPAVRRCARIKLSHPS